MHAEMQKVKPEHLKRDAYLYVRKSTPRQVLENQESTKRQYALRQRAIALGWHSDHIVVIDNDLGHSVRWSWIRIVRFRKAFFTSSRRFDGYARRWPW